MAADQEKFLQLLNSLLSTSNDVRTQAEEAYNTLPVEQKVTYLLGILHNVTLPPEVVQMAAILLRRLFTVELTDFYQTLPPTSQAELKSQVLLAVQLDHPDSNRRKICDVASEMARNFLDDDGNNTWPEFLQFLLQCANSQNIALKEIALRMFTSVPSVFGNQQSQYLEVIKQMIEAALNYAGSYGVRFQAVKAASAFILLNDKDNQVLHCFSGLLAPIIQIIMESVDEQDDEALIKSLIDIAEACPKFLRPRLDTIMEMCIKILANHDLMDSWRQLALEVIVTLAETAPAMVRKVAGKYIPMIVPQVLQLMTDLEDDPKWSVGDEIVEEDSDSNNVVGESALDRLACGLSGKTMLPHIVHNIPVMLADSDWKSRHAALMAISAVGEGCHKQMEAMLPQIMDGVINFLQDPHPRVRYAACNAIGQMSSDFAPNFEKKFHEKVIPGLLMVLDDNENPRVQAHAGAALVNFSEDCPKPILTGYLDAIMEKLESILSAKFEELVKKGTKLVLEQVVTTIASVADTSEEQFIKYYDSLMPCLKYIIQNANTNELKLLRGKTIECVSLIGLAVGNEKFVPDAREVMDVLIGTYSDEGFAEDDPQMSYLISFWARICKVFGKDFVQYLPVVIGPVMKAASLKPEVTVLDNEDMEGLAGDENWQFISLSEQQNFGLRTSGLEEKASACEMLVCYARELKENFAEYAGPVVHLMVPMLRFYFHDGVRSAAAESLPYLLESGKSKGREFTVVMWNYIWPDLLKAIDTEPENEVLSELMLSLARCIEVLGNGCLPPEAMQEILRILDKLLKDHFERAAARLEKRRDEDYDEVVEEQLETEDNEDVYILSKVADVLHSLFVTYKAEFFPMFDTLVGHFVRMLGPERPWSDRQWSLCVFDDVIEFGGPACIKYQEHFLGPILTSVQDKQPEVRQAAVYGCGILGQCGGETFAAACSEAIPRLVEVINEPDARSVEKLTATENAIAAVTKILKYNSSAVNVDEMLPHWLSWLPVWEDIDESPHVYGYLCDLIEANHPKILGPNNANLARLIAILAEAFYRGAIDESSPVGHRMLNLVREIQRNQQVFQACLEQLTTEQQVALSEALSTATGESRFQGSC